MKVGNPKEWICQEASKNHVFLCVIKTKGSSGWDSMISTKLTMEIQQVADRQDIQHAWIGQHCQDQRGKMRIMEELRMTPVCQVFIMVLIQSTTRSGFHHRMNLFIFTFATKVPVSRFSPRHFFHFFHFF
jgi:hypothetical protein